MLLLVTSINVKVFLCSGRKITLHPALCQVSWWMRWGDEVGILMLLPGVDRSASVIPEPRTWLCQLVAYYVHPENNIVPSVIIKQNMVTEMKRLFYFILSFLFHFLHLWPWSRDKNKIRFWQNSVNSRNVVRAWFVSPPVIKLKINAHRNTTCCDQNEFTL